MRIRAPPSPTLTGEPAAFSLPGTKTETTQSTYHLPTLTTIQYALNIQHQINASTAIQAGYVGWYGYNQVVTVNAENDNLVDPATGLYNTAGALKPNPGFGTITRACRLSPSATTMLCRWS